MPAPVALLSVASAVPRHVLTQEAAKALARNLFGDRLAGFDRLARVFDTSGIEKRHVAVPPQWYERQHGWTARNAAYLEAAEGLYIEAATKALAAAGLEPENVDILVTASTTGIATPSLEARVAGRMGFRTDVERVPLFGLGCAGGVTGLAIASRLVRETSKTALFVTVELCSTSLRLDVLSKANIVATALFGDGAAACLLRSGDEGALACIGEGGEVLWPDTLGIMGWDVDDPGLGVVFDRAIPPFVAEHLATGVDAVCRKAGLQRAEVRRFVCHPGGAKVIAAIESSLGLASGTLDHERAVLQAFGNMSAPTVLFVLEKALAAGFPERAMLLSLGPGFTASGLLLSRP